MGNKYIAKDIKSSFADTRLTPELREKLLTLKKNGIRQKLHRLYPDKYPYIRDMYSRTELVFLILESHMPSMLEIFEQSGAMFNALFKRV